MGEINKNRCENDLKVCYEDMKVCQTHLQNVTNRYNELKKELTELKTPNKFRIMNDKVWSTLSVFIISSSDGTNFFKRVKMFFSTIFSWAKNGFKLEEEQVFTQRMEICRGCPEFKVPEGQCRVCGCFMEKKTKLSGASCPLKKW